MFNFIIFKKIFKITFFKRKKKKLLLYYFYIHSVGACNLSPNKENIQNKIPLVHPKPVCTTYSPYSPGKLTFNELYFSKISSSFERHVQNTDKTYLCDTLNANSINSPFDVDRLLCK